MLSTIEKQAVACCIRYSELIDDKDNISYILSCAIYHFFGGANKNYNFKKITNGGSHDRYWITNPQGSVVDPACSITGDAPAYRFGQKASIRNTSKKHLPILEKLQNELGDIHKEVRPTIDIVGRQLILNRDSVLSDEQQELLNKAWRVLLKEWGSDPNQFIRSHFTKGGLAIQFVRALLYGENILRYATMAYTGERFFVAGATKPFNEALLAAVENSALLKSMRFGLIEEPSFTKLVASNLPIHGYRIPLDFPINLARDLINKYCPEGGLVLDPCHGWGGRLVGFMLSKADAYVGIDPAPHSYKLQEMFDDLNVFLAEPKVIKLINKPFEDVSLSEGFYDFALTSPPYYNTEKYQGEDSSWRRYPTLNEWIEGFYKKLINGVLTALKPGAYFCLQITTKFRMVEVAKEIAGSLGLTFERIIDTNMRRYNSSAEKSEVTDLFEVIVVFRKPGSLGVSNES